MTQDEKPIAGQMIEFKRLMSRQGCVVTRWKLPTRSIHKLERETRWTIDTVWNRPMVLGAWLDEVFEE